MRRTNPSQTEPILRIRSLNFPLDRKLEQLRRTGLVIIFRSIDTYDCA
jgi:hypothetical protein